MSDVPETAITAAAAWLHDEECDTDGGTTTTCGRWVAGSDPQSPYHAHHVGHVEFYRRRAAGLLAAALPHLTAAAAAQPGSTPDVRRQHLTLDEQRFPEPIWTCAACGSGLVNGLVAHHDNCRWLAAIRDQATTTERERILASMRLPTVPAPETATTAMTRAIQAYEPEATGAVIASPKQLLSVLLEAARRATEAAAPHIDAAARASERETIRREVHDAIRELSQPCPAPEGPR